MARGDFEYLHPRQIPGYDLYLSFTGGPTLKRLQREYGSPRARALYCSVDPELYFPERAPLQWDLGYMGTYSDDRQPSVDAFLLEPARNEPGRKFIVAGPQYPGTDQWPANVTHQPHLPPAEHRAFYTSQRFTLNVTRKDMIAAGWSPSVRLFEAAACGTPIISDRWPGLESLLVPHQEILLVDRTADVLEILRRTGEDERLRIAERARQRILAEHTAAHRAAEVEQYAVELLSGVAA
jgi:spore maturation protein CgeB